jgi:hypothetical protein
MPRSTPLRTACFLLFVLVAAGHSPADVVEINFNDLLPGTVITNQYPEATFSSEAGSDNVAISYDANWVNILCGTATCLSDTYIDFTTPVNDLTFWAIAANAAGMTAEFNVYENGVFSSTVDLVSSGGNPNDEFVDLSSFNNVTRLEIVNILNDPSAENGIGWDQFRFTVVPEPSGIFLGGIAMLAGWLGRRRYR